jgi:hypothetical protein
MPIAKLPQPYALRLEMLRAKGYSKTEMIEIAVGYNEAEFKELIHSEVDWKGFMTYRHEYKETLVSAIKDGYQFSFITFGGIKNLLAIRFNKLEDADYDIVESTFRNLTLSSEQFQLFRSLVPNHWKMSLTPFISEAGEGIVKVHIELQHV